MVPTSKPIDLVNSECKNVAISRTDRITATGGSDCDIRLFDTKNGKELFKIENAHPSRLQCLEFNTSKTFFLLLNLCCSFHFKLDWTQLFQMYKTKNDYRVTVIKLMHEL